MELLANTLKDFTQSSKQMATTQAMVHAPTEQKKEYFSAIAANALAELNNRAEELALQRDELKLKRLRVQQQLASAKDDEVEVLEESKTEDTTDDDEVEVLEESKTEDSEESKTEDSSTEPPSRSTSPPPLPGQCSSNKSSATQCSFGKECVCAGAPMETCTMCDEYKYHKDCCAAGEDAWTDLHGDMLEVGFQFSTCKFCQINNVRAAIQGKANEDNPFVWHGHVQV